MKKFLIYYWFSILAFFGLFYWEASLISLSVNTLQTELTALWTSWLIAPPAVMDGHYIVITDNYRLVIEKACNGIVPYLFFLASIVAFPASTWHKLAWALIGYLVLMVVNVVRIWMVTQFVLEGRHHFSLAHDYLGNALVIMAALGLFVLFVKTRRDRGHRERESSSNSLRKKNIPTNEVRITSTI